MWEYRETGMEGCWNAGVTGIPGFRGNGIQEYGDIGILEFRDNGI